MGNLPTKNRNKTKEIVNNPFTKKNTLGVTAKVSKYENIKVSKIKQQQQQQRQQQQRQQQFEPSNIETIMNIA